MECGGDGALWPAGPGWPRLSPTLLLSLSSCGLFSQINTQSLEIQCFFVRSENGRIMKLRVENYVLNILSFSKVKRF